MSFKRTRVDKSRQMVWDAMQMCYGSYVEQEGKKADQWRDQSLVQLSAHIAHEIEEVKANLRRGEIGYLLHNAMDVCELGAILLAAARLYIEEHPQERVITAQKETTDD